MSAADARSYWDRRILSWEAARYSRAAALNPLSWSVRARLARAAELLLADPRPRSIVDLGCGTGRLARLLGAAGPVQYLGVDVSAVALEAARASSEDRFSFRRADLRDPRERFEADAAAMLGLSDWLSPDELESLLSRLRVRRLVLSYSRRTPSWFRGLYLAYRRARFGQSPDYEPRCYGFAQLAEMLERHGMTARPARCSTLGFGNLLVATAAEDGLRR